MSTRVREETKACSRSELIFAPLVQICQPLFLKDVDEYISSENRKKRFSKSPSYKTLVLIRMTKSFIEHFKTKTQNVSCGLYISGVLIICHPCQAMNVFGCQGEGARKNEDHYTKNLQ